MTRQNRHFTSIVVVTAIVTLPFTAAAAAPAQEQDLARAVVDLVGTVATTSKQRRIRAQLSAPLVYQPSAGPLDPKSTTDPRNLDVAGVRLGMTVSQAESALRSAGYSQRYKNTGFSYADSVMTDQAIEYGVARALPEERAVSYLAWNKGEEVIEVGFAALPQGPSVTAVTYQASDDAPIAPADFVARALRKYGEPVNEDADDLRWCTVKASECERLSDAEYPLLSIWPDSRRINLVDNDPARKDALRARHAADVARRKPADKEPAF